MTVQREAGAAAPLPGDIAPWFAAPVLGNSPDFHFETQAGRYLALLFLGSAGSEAGAVAARQLIARRSLFDDDRARFFGVTRDPGDVAAGRVATLLPGIRWFLDYDGSVARRYGAIDAEGGQTDFWLLVDPMLRVLARAPIGEGDALLARLADELSAPRDEGHAPVLIVPGVFEPALCRHLVGLYESRGGRPSGFMREVDGKTIGMVDDRTKRRADLSIDDEALREQIRIRLRRRLVPLIERFLNFRVTRVERYIVACYDSANGAGGFFAAHRDNTTAGTAHRRFACTINLNADGFEGGDLVFPEFGSRRYRAPTGGAVIFGCGMLHEALPVTRGTRYADLPFLYDEAAARQREANAQSGKVEERLAGYRADRQAAEQWAEN
ncbi:2OG-Fe(II) oxygenase family protein [Rhizorhabdus dicambivorans]|uniref:Peroxiredoxin n=1 Tax=Rhizorhabdus dicambivorans TaxID=1850238 RepID=A0A2A4G2B7_9SPHN|nr:2OG-Fe(II) oxygenase [Rhizorhabdus dicambivorans]ATE66590.1 peroxiredoxin [Rhizorhabdus dicambivorans]PCE43927.1 peroxiredoxin [Rhizorhabdus dicambivorans]